MKKIVLSFLLISLFGVVGWSSDGFFVSLLDPVHPTPITRHFSTHPTTSWIDHEMGVISAQASNLSSTVLKTSLEAYEHARKEGLDNKQLLTIIDYTKPSSQRRLWVVDVKNSKVLFNTWVTHGKNSGTVMATSFSNRPGSLKSSIGVFLTEQPYFGHEGYSLRIAGLERGINDNAYSRATVIHGAWYADERVAEKYGELGRSWGCPAVSPSEIKPLINTIKDKTLLVAYYPDRHWLNNSSFLVG